MNYAKNWLKGEHEMVDAVLHATDDTFESEVIKSEVPVLLDFWAPWCGPCKALNPVIDAVAEEFSGRAKVVKVNIDENPETKAKYGVRGIPHLLIINEGETATNGLLRCVPFHDVFAFH